MPIVSSTTIPDSYTQADGTRGVRYTLADHLGVSHPSSSHIIPSVSVLASSAQSAGSVEFQESDNESYLWDGFAWKLYRTSLYAAKEAELASGETNSFIEDLRIPNAFNPFRNADGSIKDPLHQTYAVASVIVMNYVLSAELDEALEFNEAAKYLDNNTDAELKLILGLNDAGVAAVRAWQAQLTDVETAMAGYSPLMERS